MKLDDFIANLSGDLEPIRELALRLRSSGSHVADDAVALSHRPHVAPQTYALRLYAPLPAEFIARYQILHCITLSPRYLPVIEKLNGVHAFRFSLFGIPSSMAANPPLLNRSIAQPYDVATANQFWKREYAVPTYWFHFGGGPYSFDENMGYFFDPSGTIHASRKSGEQLRSWASFHQFLADELRRAEADYPAYEAFMAEAIRNYEARKPWWRRLFKR